MLKWRKLLLPLASLILLPIVPVQANDFNFFDDEIQQLNDLWKDVMREFPSKEEIQAGIDDILADGLAEIEKLNLDDQLAQSRLLERISASYKEMLTNPISIQMEDLDFLKEIPAGISEEAEMLYRNALELLYHFKLSPQAFEALITQTGTPPDVAQELVAELPVDWNMIALLAAQDYLAKEEFEVAEIAEQLRYEGFSEAAIQSALEQLP